MTPAARAPSMAVSDRLALFRWKDRPANRRQFVERLTGRMKAEAPAAQFIRDRRRGFPMEPANFGNRSLPPLTPFPEQFRGPTILKPSDFNFLTPYSFSI
jgi:hypothetical protein